MEMHIIVNKTLSFLSLNNVYFFSKCILVVYVVNNLRIYLKYLNYLVDFYLNIL